MSTTPDFPWLDQAARYTTKKINHPDYLQGYALLAVAEAIHRLAAATERVTPPAS